MKRFCESLVCGLSLLRGLYPCIHFVQAEPKNPQLGTLGFHFLGPLSGPPLEPQWVLTSSQSEPLESLDLILQERKIYVMVKMVILLASHYDEL